jgi:hypothetical protein
MDGCGISQIMLQRFHESITADGDAQSPLPLAGNAARR